MPLMPTQEGLYEGLTVNDLKARTLDRLKQKALNYDRFSEDAIMRALIDTEVEIARAKRCLHAFAYIVLKEGYAQYRAPSNMLLLKKAFYYQSNTQYWELDQRNRAWLDRHIPGWRTVTGDPTVTYPGDNYGNIRKIGFYPQPNTASGWEIDPDTGAYEKSTNISPSNNVSGLNSTAHATICTDASAKDFEALAVTVGMMALNVTDGSQGQISSVDGSQFTCALTGGTANTWAVGDSYTILSGEYGVVTSWDSSESYVFTTDYGVVTGVTNENNVFLEYFRRPVKLTFGEQYPEIPPEIHQYMPDNVVWLLKRGAPRGSSDFADAQAGREAYLAGLGGYVDLDRASEDSPMMDSYI